MIASRLSEDPSCNVALIEAGGATAGHLLAADRAGGDAAELDDRLDVHRDLGKAGFGLNGRRVPVPRGKMLGGSSGINYMVNVSGHPGDFDSWAEGGATGWSYAEVLPYFRKSEGLAPNNEITVDGLVRNTTGPLVRDPDTAGRAPIRRGGGRRRHPTQRL